MDSFERGESQNLSMREKSVLKRRVNRAHNSNFRAGYIPINEEYLHKSGIRGRKRFALYCSVFLLVVLAILNGVMTGGILYLLRFTHQGMSTLELIPDSGLVRFLAEISMDSISLRDGSLGGRVNQSLNIQTDNDMNITVLPSENERITRQARPTSLKMDADEITLETPSKEFSVKNPATKKTLFSTSEPVYWEMSEPGLNLHAGQIETGSIKSMPNKARELMVESDKSISVMGMEGVEIDSQTSYVALTAKQNVYVESEDGEIIISGDKGIHLSKKLPIPSTGGSGLDPSLQTYKLCVCMPSGQLFSVMSSRSCQDGAGVCGQA